MGKCTTNIYKYREFDVNTVQHKLRKSTSQNFIRLQLLWQHATRIRELAITFKFGSLSFSMQVPSETNETLLETNFRALNSNKFTGKIPPSIGKLSNLSWFDIADNQISGTIPISNKKSPGLDQLRNAKHL